MNAEQITKTEELRFIVDARRWFDKKNGNTYHSVRVCDARTGAPIVACGFRYGYGEQWRTTAKDSLIALGLWSKEDEFNHEKIRRAFYWTVADVNTMRECKEHGLIENAIHGGV
jgi:hypothetical protein